MTDDRTRPDSGGAGCSDSGGELPVVIATIFRTNDGTGIHTHIRQLCDYLAERDVTAVVVTPVSGTRIAAYFVFAPRLLLQFISKPASVVWYRYWHERFLRSALRRCLSSLDDCVVYAQGPIEAHAALRARRGEHQRVIMAVHFRASQADEHAEPGRELRPRGAVFRGIRNFERRVIPQVDGMVYVSQWARNALLSWLPEASEVPSAVIGNFVKGISYKGDQARRADLVSTGKLELRKNHSFVLQVLAEAKRAGRRYTLDIFGEGPERGELLKQARALNLDEQVQFCGFRSDVRSTLPGYRAYVHAASAETSSLAIIEAMAAGLPIVAANIGPIGELCDEGAEARFWSLDDPAEAARTLIELLDSESQCAEAAQAAKARFSRDFDAEVIGPRLWSFLQGAKSAVVRSA